MQRVDNEHKAYLLGWVASDGTVTEDKITIAIHHTDQAILLALRDLVCEELPVRRKGSLATLTLNSKAMVHDVCRHLDIQPGKKSRTVAFPTIDRDALSWAFLRGYFDGDGHIQSPSKNLRYPRCTITSGSARMRAGIRRFCKIRCSESHDKLEWSHTNAMDFLGKLYDGAAISLTRKRDLYLDWTTWVPSLSGSGRSGRAPRLRWVKTHPNAMPPFKERASDSGFDLTLVRIAKRFPSFTMYGTGIKIEPDQGWYFDLVPRSSIVKTGYILANSVGVIDRAYRGEVLVPLMKADPTAADLKLPARIVQIIPRPIVHFQVECVDALDDSSRGEGGFGSSGA